MALDLHLLDKTISEPDISLTLRFYFWDGDWLSIGYHQKIIPSYWKRLRDNGEIKIVRRPSGGGAVLHSRGITYALTYKKKSYKAGLINISGELALKKYSSIAIKDADSEILINGLSNGNIKKDIINLIKNRNL